MTVELLEGATPVADHASAGAGNDVESAPVDQQVVADLLVEEISIDGMCGVY